MKITTRIAIVTHLLGCTLLAAPAPTPPREDPVDVAAQKAALFLLAHQDTEGAFRIEQRNHVATTSLALLALAATGHQPTDPDDPGAGMRRALGFLLRDNLQTPDGYLGNADGSRMYGHGITTLALAELLGMSTSPEQDEQIRTRCQRGVELILRAQIVPKDPIYHGGWRYTPDSRDSDLSVTVWQTMALRAAQNAGIPVPKTAIDDAVAYIRRSYHAANADRSRKSPAAQTGGTFSYQPNRMEGRISSTAQGLLALQVCGQYDCPEVRGAADRLQITPPEPKESWFYYGLYYFAQGMYQRGGTQADQAAKHVSQILLPIQQLDGSWIGNSQERQAGPIYSTSLAVLSLAVKYHLLPIYQR
jgi:hypothetical protein